MSPEVPVSTSFIATLHHIQGTLMKPIPQQVEPELLPYLDLKGRGKVCELYDLPDYFDLRFKVISDRVSVHDIILPFLIPGKGEVLNFVDHFWRSQFPEVRHDVVAIGSQVDQD